MSSIRIIDVWDEYYSKELKLMKDTFDAEWNNGVMSKVINPYNLLQFTKLVYADSIEPAFGEPRSAQYYKDTLLITESKANGALTAKLVDGGFTYASEIDPYTIVFTQEKNYVMKEQVKNDLSTGDDQLILDNDAGGNGKITGNKLDNIIQANLYDNTLLGKDGNDLIKAGAGQDNLIGDKGNDSLYGEAGNDTLDAGTGNDSLDGGEGKDFILGGAGNDTLTGGLGKDTLDGGTENDSISGGAGSDKLLGGLGDDTLNGDESNDTLTGGKGNDIFQISSNSGNDYITDFNFSSKTSKKGATTITEEDQIHVIGHKDANGNFTLNDFFVEEAFDATLITFKDGGSILLKGITAADNLYFNEAEGYFTLNSANAIKVDFTE